MGSACDADSSKKSSPLSEAESLLNWTAWFDVSAQDIDRSHGKGKCKPLFLSSSLLQHHCPSLRKRSMVSHKEAVSAPGCLLDAPWIKRLVGCDKGHSPLPFIVPLGMVCAGAVSLVFGLGTAVTWPCNVCPGLNFKADLLLWEGL